MIRDRIEYCLCMWVCVGIYGQEHDQLIWCGVPLLCYGRFLGVVLANDGLLCPVGALFLRIDKFVRKFC